MSDGRTQLVDSETRLRQDLAGSREENAKCRAAYTEICEEAQSLNDVSFIRRPHASSFAEADVISDCSFAIISQDFNQQLEAILAAFQTEITSFSTSRPTPSLEMSSALKTAMKGQAQAEQELFMLKAQMREEVMEKERWGRMLRERGLIQ